MQRRTRRTVALGAVFAAAVAVPFAAAWPSIAAQTPVRAPRTMSVASMQALSTAISSAVPGDTIKLAAGKYPSGTIKIDKQGTAAAPITIDFQGNMSAAGSTRVTLRHYTVVRYPAVS